MWWSKILIIALIMVQSTNSTTDQLQLQCDIQNKPLEPSEPSIFVIEAKGRLGNHLMAFAIMITLAKTLKIRGYVTGETAAYLQRYFLAENVPVFENTFCDYSEMPMTLFVEDLDILVSNELLHKGHMLHLWPWGYQVILVLFKYPGHLLSMPILE
jgi:hypothetical protein